MNPLLRLFLSLVESSENVKDFQVESEKLSNAKNDEEELIALAGLLYEALKAKNDVLEVKDAVSEVFIRK